MKGWAFLRNLIVLVAGSLIVRADSMPLRAKEESFHIDTFFERANRLAMPDVIRLAERFPEGSDTAIALYSIATGRYRNDLDESSKQYCVLSWMKMGDAWYRQGDYTQAFSCYGESLRVCETLVDKSHLPDIYLKPKSVIRHAESVSDWENEAFGHLARFCPHPVSRYAST